MKSYSQILHEMQEAVDYVRGGGVSVEREDDAEFYRLLADQPDDTAITGYAPVLPELGPGTVTVETITEFQLLYKALGKVHGRAVDQYKVDADIMQTQLRHYAAQRVGYGEIRHGLLVRHSNADDKSYGWRTLHIYARPTGYVTKIALGSQMAAPPLPTAWEKQRLRLMGYTGRHDVGRRIMAAKDPRLSSLVVPSSWN